MIVVFRQQFTRVPGVQPAEQHQDRGAAVLMTAGQRGFGFAAGAVSSRHHNRYLPLCPVRAVSLQIDPQIAVHPAITDRESGRQHIDNLPLGQLSLRIG